MRKLKRMLAAVETRLKGLRRVRKRLGDALAKAIRRRQNRPGANPRITRHIKALRKQIRDYMGRIKKTVARKLDLLKKIRQRKRAPSSGPTVMYDTVDPSQFPAGAIPPAAVAGYVGGSWPTFSTLVKMYPNADKLSIAVNAAEDAECLDVEAGDATPAQAPAWVKRQQARGVKRPVVYSSISAMHEVLTALANAGIPRSAVRVWTAHYTYSPHLCGPGEYGLGTTADATQWTLNALGRNLDQSLLNPGFFS